MVGMLGLLLAFAALSVASPAGALQEEGLMVEVASFTADGWPQGQTVVTVLGGDGRTVAGLAEENFQVQVNGSQMPVRSVTRGVDSSVGIAVVLALDISGSMGGVALEQAKAAAIRFLDGLGPNDTVATVAFAQTVGQVHGFTSDRATVEAAVTGLGVYEGTALYQATMWSVGVAASSGTDRRAVVLLSDGVDTAGAVTRAEALNTAQALGVPIFTIGLGSEMDRAYLQELASRSGGQFAETPSPEGLALLYEEVGELLRGQYVVAVDGSGITLPESEAATVRVDVSVGEMTGSGERVFAPRGPVVALSGVEAGEELTAETTVVAEVISADPIASVTFFVDGNVEAEVTEPPYEFVFDPASFATGEHTLGATVAWEGGDSATAVEVAVSTGAAGAGGGGGNMTLLAAAVVIVAALGAALLVFVLGRRRSGTEGPELVIGHVPVPRPPDPEEPLPAGVPVRLWPREEEQPQPVKPETEEPQGHLLVTSGPLARQSFPVGETPTSIGSGHRCRIRLPEEGGQGEEPAPEMARVWVRGGQLMVHELLRLTAMGPVGGDWSILEPGETFSIGESAFQFQLDAGPEATPRGPREIPDILRDRSEPSPGPAGAVSGGSLGVPEAGQASTQGPGMAPAEGEGGGPDAPGEGWQRTESGG